MDLLPVWWIILLPVTPIGLFVLTTVLIDYSCEKIRLWLIEIDSLKGLDKFRMRKTEVRLILIISLLFVVFYIDIMVLSFMVNKLLARAPLVPLEI